MNISLELLKHLITRYDYERGSYPEHEYEGWSVYHFICMELGVEFDLEDKEQYEKLIDKVDQNNE